MLPSRIRLLLSRVFTVIVTVFVIGGSLGSIAAAPITPKLIASWKTSSGTSAGGYPDVMAPTGIVVCLFYDSGLNLDTSLAFPDRILSTAVVGCDRVLKPGATRVVEYNASNDSKFAAFAAKFTDSTDDNMMTFAQLVDDSLMSQGVGMASGGCESVFGKHKVKTCNVRNLLTGYTLDSIRVTASNIVATVSADGHTVSYSVDMLWEAYGHR